MIGLVFSEVILFAAAGLMGFAAGSRAFVLATEARRRADERDIEHLRGLLSEAQVRRARQT